MVGAKLCLSRGFPRLSVKLIRKEDEEPFIFWSDVPLK